MNTTRTPLPAPARPPTPGAPFLLPVLADGDDDDDDDERAVFGAERERGVDGDQVDGGGGAARENFSRVAHTAGGRRRLAERIWASQ